MKWFATIALAFLTACHAESSDGAVEPTVMAPGVLMVGRIQNSRLTESSGIVVSRRNPDLYWTHNDGGGKRQVLYGMTRDGKSIAEFRITGAQIEDWEDIAADNEGHLFLGDIGNNDAVRQTIAVHEIDEPDTKATQNGLARVTRTWNLTYSRRPFDCESLFLGRATAISSPKYSRMSAPKSTGSRLRILRPSTRCSSWPRFESIHP